MNRRTIEELIDRIRESSLDERSSASSSSIDVIASSDDLLSEILRCLPVKSLLKFKSVSKHWRSLITDPHFSCRRKPPSSLFLQDWVPPILSFVPLDPRRSHTTAPFADLSFLAHSPGRVKIESSCNGLFYCYCSAQLDDTPPTHYICNPITKQFITLPPPLGDGRACHMTLAFDPSESHVYKLFCAEMVAMSADKDTVQIQIYSSETGSWRYWGAPFDRPSVLDFDGGVYLNGAIHWVRWGTISLYFDMKEEVIREMPMPPEPEPESDIRYFGESLGHLHLVREYGSGVNVFEMKRDRSGWFLKFRVSHFNPVELTIPMYDSEIVCVVRGEKDEDSFMALHVPGKIIAYNFITKSESKICDLDLEVQGHRYPWSYAFQFSESLSPV